MQCFIVISLIYIIHPIAIQTIKELDPNLKLIVSKFI